MYVVIPGTTASASSEKAPLSNRYNWYGVIQLSQLFLFKELGTPSDKMIKSFMSRQPVLT